MTAAGLMPPRFPGWITEPDDLARLLIVAGFNDVRLSADTHSFHYASADEYWQRLAVQAYVAVWTPSTPLGRYVFALV